MQQLTCVTFTRDSRPLNLPISQAAKLRVLRSRKCDLRHSTTPALHNSGTPQLRHSTALALSRAVVILRTRVFASEEPLHFSSSRIDQTLHSNAPMLHAALRVASRVPPRIVIRAIGTYIAVRFADDCRTAAWRRRNVALAERSESGVSSTQMGALQGRRRFRWIREGAAFRGMRKTLRGTPEWQRHGSISVGQGRAPSRVFPVPRACLYRPLVKKNAPAESRRSGVCAWRKLFTDN
jgi:hypothetical protein